MSDRRQRQKEQRAAKREAEKKHDARRELFRRLGTALVFGFVVVAIFAFSGVFTGDSEQLPGSYEGFRAQETACGADQPAPEQIMSFEAPEQQTDITASSTVTATIATSCGDIIIELLPAEYPETVNSFVFLARSGFYDGQVFHRVVENFMIQGGDPQANGTGGPGYVIADEFPDDPDWSYTEGVVAMANRGARSTGSQFFIVVGDDARHLTPLFNVLGTVVSGEDALEKIAVLEKGIAPGSVEQSLPLQSVYIDAITIDVTGS
ncbi:MAG: peptidylprolyl isomerase [Actinomycetota bacterium]|nr:peptidylprolyl isomerase [Actinomycetota bacterium]